MKQKLEWSAKNGYITEFASNYIEVEAFDKNGTKLTKGTMSYFKSVQLSDIEEIQTRFPLYESRKKTEFTVTPYDEDEPVRFAITFSDDSMGENGKNIFDIKIQRYLCDTLSCDELLTLLHEKQFFVWDSKNKSDLENSKLTRTRFERGFAYDKLNKTLNLEGIELLNDFLNWLSNRIDEYKYELNDLHVENNYSWEISVDQKEDLENEKVILTKTSIEALETIKMIAYSYKKHIESLTD